MASAARHAKRARRTGRDGRAVIAIKPLCWPSPSRPTTIARCVNRLFYGDNLDVLRRHIADASVDLVYLDPPFQSGKEYNLIFERRSGKPEHERAQAEAFKDSWKWGPEAEEL